MITIRTDRIKLTIEYLIRKFVKSPVEGTFLMETGSEWGRFGAVHEKARPTKGQHCGIQVVHELFSLLRHGWIPTKRFGNRFQVGYVIGSVDVSLCSSPVSRSGVHRLFLSSSGATYDFTFNVKFYPPDPAQLSEDLTRYASLHTSTRPWALS